MITEAIILAGGQGTRLSTIVSDVPKPMANVCGSPFLEILINELRNKGIRHIILALGYKAEVIQNYFGNKYKDIKISYVVESKQLGTGGAIKLATTMMGTDNALILNGDSFIQIDMKLANTLLEKHSSPIIFGVCVNNSFRYGRVDHDNGIIVGFREKGEVGSGIISAGVYIFPKNLLNDFSPNTYFSIEDDYFKFIKKEHKFRLAITESYFIDIGIPEDYQRAQKELLKYVK